MPKITSDAKQTKTYNCGAFGLAAICGAFGLLPSENKVFLHHRGRSATLAPNLALLQAAEEIYKITGDLKPTGEHASEGEYTNSPSAISYVAKKLGLNVILSVPKEALNKTNPFTNELIYCADVANQVNDNKGVYRLPEEQECQLVVVQTTSNGLHWLAIDSDGLIYDPATGKTYSDWDSLTCYARLPFWLSFFLK
jgi:hypothetical protein